MQITSPLWIHAEIPAIVLHVPAGTALLTIPRPAPPLANPTSAIVQASLARHRTLPLAQVAAASPGDLEKPPLTSGYACTGESRLAHMVQHAIQRALAVWQQRRGRMPRLGVIRDGTHTIPRLIGASTTV